MIMIIYRCCILRDICRRCPRLFPSDTTGTNHCLAGARTAQVELAALGGLQHLHDHVAHRLELRLALHRVAGLALEQQQRRVLGGHAVQQPQRELVRHLLVLQGVCQPHGTPHLDGSRSAGQQQVLAAVQDEAPRDGILLLSPRDLTGPVRHDLLFDLLTQTFPQQLLCEVWICRQTHDAAHQVGSAQCNEERDPGTHSMPDQYQFLLWSSCGFALIQYRVN
mmetsp:Transcript_29102/g.39978  ORF Transcript_29102/g.39978 Transcript_29102/m.39978 type:complete len:222 (-) Transcript_29102:436-1101(-)